jgi:hypothetical protein
MRDDLGMCFVRVLTKCACARWASGYRAHVAASTPARCFRVPRPTRHREDDDAVDGAIHNST